MLKRGEGVRTRLATTPPRYVYLKSHLYCPCYLPVHKFIHWKFAPTCYRNIATPTWKRTRMPLLLTFIFNVLHLPGSVEPIYTSLELNRSRTKMKDEINYEWMECEGNRNRRVCLLFRNSYYWRSINNFLSTKGSFNRVLSFISITVSWMYVDQKVNCKTLE